jgi:uncharacterized protein YjbJ (UPF0337 family)
MTDAGDRDRVEGTLKEAKGNVKQAWGDLTADDQLKAEGVLDEAKGKAQQVLGDVKDKVEDIKDEVERKTR